MTDSLNYEEFEDAVINGDPEEKKPFAVDSSDEADWCLSKLRAIRNAQQAITADADKRVARIRDWEELEITRLDSKADYFTGLLEGYARQQEGKTVTLVNGKLKKRKVAAGYQHEDKTILQWLLTAAPEPVRTAYAGVKTTTVCLWSALKDALNPDGTLTDKTTGEVLAVPGIAPVAETVAFSVEFTAD